MPEDGMMFSDWIVPPGGEAPYEVDFSEFYFGRNAEDNVRGAKLWKRDILGMPNLAEDFRHVMLVNPVQKKLFPTYASAWRNIHRFLEDNPDLPPLNSISDFLDIHGMRLKQWTKKNKLGVDLYKRIKWILDKHFQEFHRSRSPFPARDATKDPDPVEPDFVGLQRLGLALRNHARSIKAMWREGARLAASGMDPRKAVEAWDRPENHVKLVYVLTNHHLPTREQLSRSDAKGLNDPSIAFPSYCPPGAILAEKFAYGVKLRWRFPSMADLSVFLWMFLIMTGFNLAAALDIDVTKDDTWFLKALQDEDHVLIFSRKEKVGKRVYSPSKVKAEFHAFSIIKLLIEASRPLRATATRQLNDLEKQNRSAYSHERQQEIVRLRHVVKSPWLFVRANDPCKVYCLLGAEAPRLNTFIRLVADEAGLLEEHEYLATLTTSQARDSMINFAYRHSKRLSIAKLASGHSDFRSLRYYLAKKKIKRANFRTVNNVLTHTFAAIRADRVFDETQIKISLTNGEITPEQKERLLDYRQRTRLGMGCLNPTDPPREIAPNHPENQVCRIQRCTGCVHGRVFPESVQPLAATLADLFHLKRKVPLASWQGSSFEEEAESIALTLQLFDPAIVAKHFRARQAELEAGAEVFDVYPHY
ncbi:hypothetical protein [Rhizobium sp. Root1220]|uniref:hypothetical protein n=1 Tax=Rhizobium sp. Root1220 TaxID=1736432 RepID=UPI0006F87C42|nr:hypothetical protein [Rhizobium sp. Root1220]KQV83570.1 hypothetical protein ASC90_19945 [Rhizobium sp. Root1220]